MSSLLGGQFSIVCIRVSLAPFPVSGVVHFLESVLDDGQSPTGGDRELPRMPSQGLPRGVSLEHIRAVLNLPDITDPLDIRSELLRRAQKRDLCG